MSKSKELKEAEADLAYWKPVAEYLGCTVMGFSYRHTCTLLHGDMTMQIHGWFAEKILEKINESS